MTHAGYEELTGVPIAYVVVEGTFAREDALTLVNDIFPSLGCIFIQQVVCFSGSVARHVGEYSLKTHMNPVRMGASISVAGANNSFASGLHIRSKDARKFIITVHHGVSSGETAISPDKSIPTVQPSQLDLDEYETTLRERIADVAEYGLLPESPHSPDYYNKRLTSFRNQDHSFGMAVYSDFGVVDFEGRRTNSDICVIDISDVKNRTIENSIYMPSENEGLKFRCY